LHLRSLGPKPSMLLLHYALVSPATRGRGLLRGNAGRLTLAMLPR